MPKIKEKIYLITIILLVALCAQFYFSYRYEPQKQKEITVYYNQEQALNKELISLIRDADKFVFFAVYTFTRFDIKDALLAAHLRGVKVIGLTDREQALKTENQTKIIAELKQAGIPIYENDHTGIMHLKAVVTEKAYASGSFNWTSAATNLNDEILEIGKDEDVRKQYQIKLERLFELYGKQN